MISNSCLPWENGANLGKMGGEWQVTFQAVASNDRGGTTCWMRQNYGNQPWLHDSVLSLSNEAWSAEILRLNFDPATLHRFRAADLIRVTARQGLFYGGKRNINEGHDTDPAFNFDIALVSASYGLPAPEVITLSDVVQPGGDPNDSNSWPARFDPTRATGGEHYQGMRVRLNDLTLLTTNGWNATNFWNDRKCVVTDGAARYFTLRRPRSSLGPAPTNRFDAIGIFTQESGSALQGTNGYELFVQQVIPQVQPALGIAPAVLVTWPTSGAQYQLEYRLDLNQTNWLPATQAPVVIDQQTAIVLPSVKASEEFFRLRKTN